ncbi:MAG: class I SAM-dependent methyltransferase [Theionarchaea archaeon]|nr:MAG: hypothetical protein AYK19_02685 [Theionarchaea archaeon DG-70-1]MBU7029539.1 class I SAM-dependent methyltransferase [Theionarchaea archaeon]
MSKLKVRTDYDRSAFCYDKRYRKIQWEKYMIMIDIPLKGRILDLGCGTGLLAEYLQRNVIGVDISLNMLKKAKTKERVIRADMDFLPFRTSVFDAVLSFTSVQNLPSLDYVFKEVRRVLKKEHPFIFTMLHKEFSPSVVEKVTLYFAIDEKRLCGEDIGFVCL